MSTGLILNDERCALVLELELGKRREMNRRIIDMVRRRKVVIRIKRCGSPEGWFGRERG